MKNAQIWNEWNTKGGPNYPHEKVIQFTFRNFPKNDRNNIKVLDLGCGSRVHTLFLACEGFVVHGIDVSSIGITNSLNKIRELGLNAQVSVGSVDNICYADNTFDYVLSIGVFECISQQMAYDAINEIIRVLKPNGLALLIFASEEDYRIRGSNPYNLHGYSEHEVKKLLPLKGLSITYIDRYITTYENQKYQQNDFLITLKKGGHIHE